MANDTIITINGGLADDPTLRFTASGAAVVNFRVLSTPRSFDRTTNEWKKGVTTGWNCSAWRQLAENIAESLTKGSQVIVQGRVVTRHFDTKEGEKRTVIELEVDEIGPSLRYATAKVAKVQRGQAAPQGDPWAQEVPSDDVPF